MRDAFYTILVIWIIWRVLNSVAAYKNNRSSNSSTGNDRPSDGEIVIESYSPITKKIKDDEGEYVDFEEIK